MAKGNALQAAKARIVSLERNVSDLQQYVEQQSQQHEIVKQSAYASLTKAERHVRDLLSVNKELHSSVEELRDSRHALQKSAEVQFATDAKTIKHLKWLVTLACVTFVIQGITYVIS